MIIASHFLEGETRYVRQFVIAINENHLYLVSTLASTE